MKTLFVLLFMVSLSMAQDYEVPSDTVSPGTPVVRKDPKLLTWTSPGDDGNVGTAAEYDIRYYDSLITEENWASCYRIQNEPVPETAGTVQTYTMPDTLFPGVYYAAIKTRDEAFNWSGLSNVVSWEVVWDTIIVIDTTPPPVPVLVYIRRGDSLYVADLPPGFSWMTDPLSLVLKITATERSEPIVVGDVTGDQLVKLSDIIFLLNYVLKDGLPPPPDTFTPQIKVGTPDSVYFVGSQMWVKRR